MNLRSQVIRLAQANSELRPLLIQVLAGSGLVPLLSKVFTRELLLDGDHKITTKVLRTDEEEIDNQRSTDHWDYSRDTHYTKNTGFYLSFEYASQVLCEVTVKVPDLPPNAAKRDVESTVARLLEMHAKEMFESNIENEGMPWDILDGSVEARGGSVSGIIWKVRDAKVRSVDARFRGNDVEVVFQVLLTINVDTKDVEATPEDRDYDPPDRDYDDGRFASLRKEIIRLAHTHPEFRSDLLPLVVK